MRKLPFLPSALYLTFTFWAMICLPNTLWAASDFALNYNLTEGGYKLELAEDNLYKGVKLIVDSTVAKRYEVRQYLVQPLQNREDPSLKIDENFVFHSLKGTNRYGDLRVPSGDSPVRSGEVLYVSDALGNPDTFTLVYGLSRSETLAPGEYAGRLAFTLQPIAANLEPVTKILEIEVNIGGQNALAPRIEISPLHGLNTMRMNAQKKDAQTTEVAVKISGNFKTPFNLKQFLLSPLESQDGTQLAAQNVVFFVKQVAKGTAPTQQSALSQTPQLIYTSRPSGEADASFVINYAVADLSGQKYGRYRSRLQYLYEDAKTQSKLTSLELEIENERIFELVVTPQEQKYSIEFRDLKPLEAPKKSEVIIEVKTNLSRPYQVNQDIPLGLTNKKGEQIKPEYFTLETKSLATKGTLKFPEKTPVKKGSSVLFLSDAEGSPSKFKLVYELACPPDVTAGDYTTNVAYSLSEM